MEILSQLRNEIFKRNHVKLLVDAGKNPTLNEASEIVAKEFNAGKEKISIQNVKGKFGRDTFLISAFIYDSEEEKNSIEPKSKKQLEAEAKAEEEAKKAEKAAAAAVPAEAAPVEEKKEEAPIEETKVEEKTE